MIHTQSKHARKDEKNKKSRKTWNKSTKNTKIQSANEDHKRAK